ncbi:MAG: YraN family protein [Thermoanaerobacteraceae bacterium]
MNNKILGNLGENIASEYLKNSGYKIIKKNFKCKIGEIDIIAKYKNTIYFIEVKTRTSIKYGVPAESVNFYKQARIIKVAQFYLSQNPIFDNLPIGFDVIEIYINKNNYEFIKINHIKDAFTL